MTSNAWMRAAVLATSLWLSGCGSADQPSGGSAGSGGNIASGGGAGGASGGSGGTSSGGASGKSSGTDGGGSAGESGAGAGDGGGVTWDGGPCPRFVVSSPQHAFGPGQDLGQAAFPVPILGPPLGEGTDGGSTDVVSLGNGGMVVVEFGGTRIIDEPGPDFIVFENAFWVSGDPSQPFAELATVEVSEDGQSWSKYPCDAVSAPYGSCAGWHPVLANAQENDVDPLDPAVAGGDAFDLADLGVKEARYVRITDRVDLTGMDGVFDLDAVGVVHAQCP